MSNTKAKTLDEVKDLEDDEEEQEELIDKSGSLTDEEEEEEEDEDSYKDSNSFVQVKRIFTDPDEVPERELSDTDKNYIQSFNAREYQNELDKARFDKIAWMIHQSKQIFWRAFRKIGEDPDTGKVEWEARDYKYHPITGEEEEEINNLQGEYETLFNEYNLFKGGVVNDSLYRSIIGREEPVVKALKRMELELHVKKFGAYFKESNEAIIKQILKVDRRDLIDAAEYRESNVPFSRRRESSPTMFVSNRVQKTKKK